MEWIHSRNNPVINQKKYHTSVQCFLDRKIPIINKKNCENGNVIMIYLQNNDNKRYIFPEIKHPHFL